MFGFEAQRSGNASVDSVQRLAGGPATVDAIEDSGAEGGIGEGGTGSGGLKIKEGRQALKP